MTAKEMLFRLHCIFPRSPELAVGQELLCQYEEELAAADRFIFSFPDRPAPDTREEVGNLIVYHSGMYYRNHELVTTCRKSLYPA